MTYLDIHPLHEALPMKNVVARSEHVVITVADINVIIANNTIQSLSCRCLLTHCWASNFFRSWTKPRSVSSSTTISRYTITSLACGRCIAIQQWRKLNFGCCTAWSIARKPWQKRWRYWSAVVKFWRQESLKEQVLAKRLDLRIVPCKQCWIVIKNLPLWYHKTSTIFGLGV